MIPFHNFFNSYLRYDYEMYSLGITGKLQDHFFFESFKIYPEVYEYV